MESNGIKYDKEELIHTILCVYFNKPIYMPNFENFEINSEYLDRFVGVYSSKKDPGKMTVKREDNKLIAYAPRLQESILEPDYMDVFNISKFRATFIFTPDENKLIFKQPDLILEFYRE